MHDDVGIHVFGGDLVNAARAVRGICQDEQPLFFLPFLLFDIQTLQLFRDTLGTIAVTRNRRTLPLPLSFTFIFFNS